jgi:hypothetical protein
MARRNTPEKPNGHVAPQGGANGHSPHEVASISSKGDNKTKPIPGAKTPLPDNSGDFVEQINRRTDLLEVWQTLLNDNDLKIKQRAVEKLTEMRYKGVAALADEPQQIVIDIDSAVARRAAEGARK